MSLSIEEYNEQEHKGKIKLSNRFIRAFRPKLFEAGGFPTSVQVEDELIRYIDSMHAYSFDDHYNKLCEGITYEEFELLKKCTYDIYEFTKNVYNGEFLVKAPMIASICEKRIIEASLGSTENKRVFEIGGGSGTLGCLLLEDEIKYAATDVTQAFYLIQNRLFNHICKNDINELVNEKFNNNSRCIHVPYWKLWEMRNDPIETDLVVSNHALLEMSPNSLRFYLNFCRKALEKSKDSVFVFQGGGWRIDQNLIDLINLFEEYGYYLKYFDHSKEIAGFSLQPGSIKNDVVRALENLLNGDVEIEKIYALGNHILERLNSKEIYFTGTLGEMMNDKFEKIKKMEKIDIETVKSFYSQFGDLKMSPDDEFGEYILSRKK